MGKDKDEKPKTLRDAELDNMSDDELREALGKSIADAEQWEAENPDPER